MGRGGFEIVLACSVLAGCSASHAGRDAALDAAVDAEARDAGARLADGGRDARMDAAAPTDAGAPAFACDPSPALLLDGTSNPVAFSDHDVVADTDGWIAVWVLDTGAFAARPGGALVRLSPPGHAQAIAAAPVASGTLVCTWPDASGSPGECRVLDRELRIVAGPTPVPYAAVARLARVGGSLHAIVPALATITDPATWRLVPIDEHGVPSGSARALACPHHYLLGAPAANDVTVACLVARVPRCDSALSPDCQFAVQLVAADGTLGPDVPLPVAPPGAGNFHSVAIGARDDGFLVAWVAADGLHAFALSASGAPIGHEHLPMIEGAAFASVHAIASGYAVSWDAPASRQLRFARFDARGRLVAPPADASDRSWMSAAAQPVAASARDGWALVWLERGGAHARSIAFRAMGCASEGECAMGLVRCVDGDGIARCVDPEREPCDCGACGTRCAACESAACAECGPGLTACVPASCVPWQREAFCFDLQSDPQSCGACGNACGDDQRCVDGACCAARETMCSRFEDRDCDGRRGCDDCDCVTSGECGFADPGVELSCDNGFSEDFDGLVDCADPDCASASVCAGAGRCPARELGSEWPVRETARFAPVDRQLAGSCGGASTAETTYRWTAPRAGTFTFALSAAGAAVLYALDGGCGGAELACGSGELTLTLAAGQSVVLVADGALGCHQLDVR